MVSFPRKIAFLGDGSEIRENRISFGAFSATMRRAIRRLVIVLVAALVLFLFLVPVVYVQPQGVFFCPINGCNFPRFGSVSYWAVRFGGVWMDRGYYAFIL